MTGTLGSLHAFSVFLLLLEALFKADRAAVSLIYSLALISLTAVVLAGHHIYPRFSASILGGGACLIAGSGLAVASVSGSLVGVYVGYGLVFGAANGLGYGFILQLVAQTFPKTRGLAMGVVTGAYALGAVVFAKVFAELLIGHSVAETMLYMAGFLCLVAVIVGVTLKYSGAIYASGDETDSKEERDPGGATVCKLWMGYGLGSVAGLMALGHATAIVVDAGGQGAMIVLGAMVIGLGNGIAGFIAGFLADRLRLKLLLIGLPLLSSSALGVLIVVSDPPTAIGALAVIGCAYGAIIAVYPVAVVARYGPAREVDPEFWTPA